MTSDPAIYDYMSQSKNGEGGIYNITNLNLYHYAGNNPIKYTDPDGRDYDETEVISVPAGFLLALKISLVFSKDDKGDYAIGFKALAGVGFGMGVGIGGKGADSVEKGLKLFSDIYDKGETVNGISNMISDQIRQDTNDDNNFDGLFSFKAESYKDWDNNAQVETAVLVGLKSDRKGNILPNFDLGVKANAYLGETAIYFNLSSAWKGIVNGFKKLGNNSILSFFKSVF